MSLTEEAAVCLQDQGIDYKNWDVGRVRWTRGLRDDDGGVGRGRGIDGVSEVLETTTEAVRIQGQRRRLRCRNDGHE